MCVRTCAIMWARKPVYAAAPALPMSTRPDLLFIRVVLPQVRVRLQLPASLASPPLKIPAHHLALSWIRVQDNVRALVNPSNYKKKQKKNSAPPRLYVFRKLCANYAQGGNEKKKKIPTRLVRLLSF